jgi:hypothetical protein
MQPPLDTKNLQGFILAVVRQRGAGAGVAIGSAALADKATSLFNKEIRTREVRQAVHDLRAEGQPICSSGAGFFWPASLQDVFQTVDVEFRSLARSELLTARLLRDAGRRLFGGQWRLL